MIKNLAHGGVHKIPRRWVGAAVLFLFLQGLLACGNANNAGGKTVETTNGIAGIVHYQGVPAARVQVFLLPANYVPSQDPLLDSGVIISLTDDQGRYSFEDLAPGAYNVLARKPQQNLAGIQQNLVVAEETGILNLDFTDLERTGSLVLSLRRLPVSTGDLFFLPGTDVFARVQISDLQSGVLVLDGLPPSTYGNLVLLAVQDSLETSLDLGSAGSIETGSLVELDPLSYWPYSLRVELRTAEFQLDNQLPQFPLRIALDESRLNMDSVASENNARGRWPVFCVIDGQNRILPYHIARWNTQEKQGELWILLDTLRVSTVDTITVVWNRPAICGSTDSAAVFSRADQYGLVAHLQDIVFDGSTSIPHEGMLGQPQALTLTAEVVPDSGWLGGEVVSVGDHFGFRVDGLPEQLGFYAYYSLAGPSNWAIISGHQRGVYPIATIVSLVVDPGGARFELYINGRLHHAYDTTQVFPLTWDKLGTNVVIGKHPTRNEGFFRGRMGTIILSPSALSASWIMARDRTLQGIGVNFLQ